MKDYPFHLNVNVITSDSHNLVHTKSPTPLPEYRLLSAAKLHSERQPYTLIHKV